MSCISSFLVVSMAMAGVFAQEYAGYARAQGNCPGSVLNEQQVASGNECAELCSANEACKGFTIGNSQTSSGRRLCILKSNACSQPQASPDFTFHSKQTKQAILGYFDDIAPWYPPAPYPPPPPPPPPAPFMYGVVPGFTRANGNCQGNFLSGVLALPLEQCAAQCITTPGCAGFSFNLHAPFPQCILKAAVCPFPDPAAVFTFFARAGLPPPPPPPPSPYYAYVPEVYVPEIPPPPPPPVAVYPWVKSARRFFKESNELCSGRILKNPEDLDLDKCADACLADPKCTGFSFDNYAKSSPFSCTLRAEACQAKSNSTRWSYFERQNVQQPHGQAQMGDVDHEYLHALESQRHSYKPSNNFFDMQKFFSQRGNAAYRHGIPTNEQIKRH